MKNDFLTLTSNFTSFFLLMTHIFLHGLNYLNARVLINHTNVRNNVCFGLGEPKMWWKMQCSQISGISNNFSQVSFSDLLIIRTKKQTMIKIGACMGLHLYTKKYYITFYFLEKYTSEYVATSNFLVCWQNYEVFVFFNNFFFL